MKRTRPISDAINFSRTSLTFRIVEGIGWLEHHFTTRRFQEDSAQDGHERVEMSRRLHRSFFSSARALVWGEQPHGNGVTCVESTDAVYTEISGVDALLCDRAGVCLVAYSADCPIVYVVDRVRKAIGIIHSGRAGTEMNLVTSALREMRAVFGTSTADCIAIISPSIGPCCYPKDLWHSLEEELVGLGIGDLLNPRFCTACNPELFFSYKREKGRCGRMLAAMMIKP